MSVKISETSGDLDNAIQNKIITYADSFQINQSIDDSEARRILQDNLLSHPAFQTTKEKGDSLEAVVQYFMNSSGMFTGLRHNTSNQIHQIDHYAMFSRHLEPILHGLFQINNLKIIGESKNYTAKKNKLGVDIVYKVEGIKLLTSCGLSVYFTRGELTGSEISDAIALAGNFCKYREPKTVSIVFNDEDWIALSKKPKNFNKYFFYKIDQFILHQNFKMNFEEADRFGD